MKFLEGSAVTLIGCGKENIRIFKIKNNFMPSQLVSLNNTARGKVFNNSTAVFGENKKVKQVYVTTECGCMFFINFYSRQVDKIIEIHDSKVKCLVSAGTFHLTASDQGVLKIWNADFSKLVSEVSLNQEVTAADINVDKNQICIMASDGTLSILELDTNSFRVLMRSH
jgi:WD40 repeat protein